MLDHFIHMSIRACEGWTHAHKFLLCNCLLIKSLPSFLTVSRRVTYESQPISYLLLNRLFLAPELDALNLEAKNFEALCFLVLCAWGDWIQVSEGCCMDGTMKKHTDCFSSLHCISCARTRLRDCLKCCCTGMRTRVLIPRTYINISWLWQPPVILA